MNELEKTKTSADEAKVEQKTFVTRRRLVKSAALGGTVLTALSSHPVLGTTSGGACTFSGWLSGNLSGSRYPTSCGGRSPGYYMNRNSLPDWCFNQNPGFRYHPGIHSTIPNWGTGSPLPDNLPEASECGGRKILGETDDEALDHTFKYVFDCVPQIDLNSIPDRVSLGITADNITLMEVLRSQNGSLEFHAVAALLNANNPAYNYGMMAQAVINEYCATGNDPIARAKLKAFFESTYH